MSAVVSTAIQTAPATPALRRRMALRQIDDTRRQRFLVTNAGVLVFDQELRAMSRGEAWVIVGARVIRPSELLTAADDIRDLWRRAQEPGGV